jgi:hypothetical protein
MLHEQGVTGLFLQRSYIQTHSSKSYLQPQYGGQGGRRDNGWQVAMLQEMHKDHGTWVGRGGWTLEIYRARETQKTTEVEKSRDL